jgi:hypothetical protein
LKAAFLWTFFRPGFAGAGWTAAESEKFTPRRKFCAASVSQIIQRLTVQAFHGLGIQVAAAYVKSSTL